MTDRDTIAELREKVGQLEETLRQLEEMLAPSTMAYPINWALSVPEALVLSCLVAGPAGYRTKAQLLHILTAHSIHDEIGMENVNTRIHWLRKKLKPLNIHIETRYGLGFQLTIPSLAALRALHAASKAALCQPMEP